MLAQEVSPEIVARVAPESMDVLGIVCGVVEFDEKRRAVNAIVDLGSRSDRTGPCEVDGINACGFHPSLWSHGKRGRDILEVGVEQRNQSLLWVFCQVGRGDSSRAFAAGG